VPQPARVRADAAPRSEQLLRKGPTSDPYGI